MRKKSPRYNRNRPWREYWAFSVSELLDPGECHGDDELTAYLDIDDTHTGALAIGVIVHRNGHVTDRFEDGTLLPFSTKRRNHELQRLAARVETLMHQNGEETLEWRDVRVDRHGNFITFLDTDSKGRRKC